MGRRPVGCRLRGSHLRHTPVDGLLSEHFGTQRSKDWFDRETFFGLARLRCMECRAPEHFAEAFTLRKARIF